ncbi:MAG: cytochrome c biogenesis protein ResB [Planctomycetes bacterium]|nr:cytochrome c biogenesis protein ResB [Planctomycetota bacterium]
MSTVSASGEPRAASHGASELKLEARGSRLAARALLARWWRTLRSVRFALILMAIIAVACIIGTLVKQEPYDPNKTVAQSVAQSIGRYGRPLGLLIELLDLNRLYHTWWFLALLSLFVASTVACTVPRLRWSVRSIGSAAVHLSIVLIVAGALAKGLAGSEGVLTVAEGEASDAFQVGQEATADGRVRVRTAPLGFTLRLDDFDIERYDAAREVLLVAPAPGQPQREERLLIGQPTPIGSGGTTIEVLRYVPHFVYSLEEKKVISASDQPINPAIQVRVKTPEGERTRWLYARHDLDAFHGHGAANDGPQLRYLGHLPGPVKSYTSHVTILDAHGNETRQAAIRVNEPLTVGRYTIYQSGFDPRTERSSTLEVVHDPGVPFVFAGFILMPLGIAFVFYIQPLFRRKAGREAQTCHRDTESAEKRNQGDGV